MTAQRTWAAIDEIPAGRTLLSVAFVHTAVEFGAWILIAVVAFDRGGASAAGAAAAAQLIPAAIVAPAVAAAGDRFARHRVLLTAMMLLATFAFGIALVLSREAPLVVLYAVAACFTAALSAAPGTLASLLVHHASSPHQLTICNAAVSTVRAVGSLSGPLLAAIMLATLGPTSAFVGIGALCLFGAALVARFVPPDDRVRPGLRLRNIWQEMVEGIVSVGRGPGLRRIVGYLSVVRLFAGALDVALLAIAYDQLGGDGSTAAGLAACVAAGAVVASIAYSTITARRPHLVRLAATALAGGVMSVAPLCGIVLSDNLAWVVLLVAVIGAGEVLIEVGGHTILQRVADETVTSRVFGVLDSTSMAFEAAGALGAGALIAGTDIETSLIVISAVGTALVLLFAGTVRRTERSTVVADPAMIATLRTVPFFASLPLPTLERLARFMDERRYTPGSTIIDEGQIGSEFYVLLDGSVDIEIGTEVIRTTGPPEFFGEIALLRDEPRSATVRANGAVRVGVLERLPFLAAVVGTSSSRVAADAVVVGRQRRT